MDWLETKYIGLISSKLDRFKRKSSSSYNFRCPVCGDSKKNKSKARGWIFDRSGKSRFYCHNCNASMSLNGLVKHVDTQLYQEFKLERLREQTTSHDTPKTVEVVQPYRPLFERDNALRGLKRVSQLHHNDPHKLYVVSRRIPFKFHYKLYIVDAFFAYVNTLIPDKFDEKALLNDEPRLLIPFINKNNKVHALQGRSFNEYSKSKYITIVLDDSVPKIYGLDTVNQNDTIYVTEGPIDSMFLDNAIAAAGGDLASATRSLDKDKLVIVYDNERRSKQTVEKIAKSIKDGYKVCLWPDTVVHKDINDMIKTGMKPEYVQLIIEQYVYSGLAAEMELSRWKRVDLSKNKNYSTQH